MDKIIVESACESNKANNKDWRDIRVSGHVLFMVLASLLMFLGSVVAFNSVSRIEEMAANKESYLIFNTLMLVILANSLSGSFY